MDIPRRAATRCMPPLAQVFTKHDTGDVVYPRERFILALTKPKPAQTIYPANEHCIKVISLCQRRQRDSNPIIDLFPRTDKNRIISWTCLRARKESIKLCLTCYPERKIRKIHTRHQSDAIVPRRDGSIDGAPVRHQRYSR